MAQLSWGNLGPTSIPEGPLEDLARTGIYRPGERYGYSGPTIGASHYERQIENVFKPALQKVMDDQRRRDNLMMAQPGAAQFSRPTGALAPQAGVVPSTSGNTPQGPVEVLSLTKDPEIEQDLLGILSKARGTDPGALRSQPRNTRVDEVLGNELARFRGDTTRADQSIRDFVSEFLDDRDEYRSLVDMELNAIRSILAPRADPTGLAGSLAANEATGRVNRNQVTRQVLDQVARAGKSAELATPGGSNTYLARETARDVTNALLQHALANQAAERQNILDTVAAQTGVLGRGDALLDAYMRQGLVPIEAENRLSGDRLAQLMQLLGQEQANTYVDRPYDDIGRQLEALAAASGVRRGVRFEGVGGQFDTGVPNARVWPTDLGGGGGGGVDLETILAMMENDAASVRNPMLRTTAGTPAALPAPISIPPALSQAAINMDILRNAGLNYDMGPGSDAALLGLPGTTTTTSRGETFVRNPMTGRYDLVGPDGLTDAQRFYDSPAAPSMEDIFLKAGLNYDMGPGSEASLLGLLGTTTTNSRGERLVRNPVIGRYDMVGPDGLTNAQRFYD